MKTSTKTMKCDCGGNATKRIISKTIPLGGRRVPVKNIEAFVCEKCGEIYFDGPTILKLGRQVKKQSAVIAFEPK